MKVSRYYYTVLWMIEEYKLWDENEQFTLPDGEVFDRSELEAHHAAIEAEENEPEIVH